jgi:NAD(P)H dehydrogenase (quinone)
MNPTPRILILGATGQVGGAIIPLLKDHAEVAIIAAARVPKKAEHFGVPVVHLDLDRIETFAPALNGVDRLFLATGYTVDMLRQSKDLINAAKQAGVKQIVHLGACSDNDTRVAHYGWHQYIERYIEWSGIGFTHLRPEIFMQNLLGYGGESYVKDGVIRHYVGEARLS